VRKSQLSRVVAETPNKAALQEVGDESGCPFGCSGRIRVTAITGIVDDRIKGDVDHVAPTCRRWNRYMRLTREQKDLLWMLPTERDRRDVLDGNAARLLDRIAQLAKA
jgi:hypothetical protein